MNLYKIYTSNNSEYHVVAQSIAKVDLVATEGMRPLKAIELVEENIMTEGGVDDITN
jgi:hypothetical protein